MTSTEYVFYKIGTCFLLFKCTRFVEEMKLLNNISIILSLHYFLSVTVSHYIETVNCSFYVLQLQS